MKRFLYGFLFLVVLGLAYLAAWPVDIDPERWLPPTAKKWEKNNKLAGGQHLHRELPGPEAIAFDAQGRPVTGLLDGRVVRLDPEGVLELTRTGGRPLGLAYDAQGGLVIADAEKGLLRLPPGGRGLELLVDRVDGKKLLLVDDVVIAADGTIYFSDASDRYDLARHEWDVLEHRPRGRVLAYVPSTQTTQVIAKDLYFANGVALGPDDAYLVVNETSSYRVSRVWLKGERAGQKETLVDNLPGFPDNVTWSPTRKVFWLALVAPRDPTLDDVAGQPFLRTVIARLPRFVQPRIKPYGWILAIDEAGRVVADLQGGPYAPVTSVREHDGKLWLGSFRAHGFYQLAAP